MAEDIDIPSYANLPRPDGHPAAPVGKIGVLLVNLGTPEAPEVGPIKTYLGEFLSDRRVVELPAIIWQPILRGLILNTRPPKTAIAYGKIWLDDGSPLMVYPRGLAPQLHAEFADAGMGHVHVDFAMVASLYPQYSGATTGTANDKVFETLQGMRWQPAIRIMPPYHDDSHYIKALADMVEHQVAKLDFKPDAIIASFHGMPLKTLYDGDPYHCHCRKTGRLLSEHMAGFLKANTSGPAGHELIVSFQSRFGRAKWLEPATDETLEALPEKGIKKVAIFAPGFAVDCVETLEELAIEGKEEFMEAGGEEFAYLPCLNTDPISQDLMSKLVRRELAGWI
jgi:ferrochelatase